MKSKNEKQNNDVSLKVDSIINDMMGNLKKLVDVNTVIGDPYNLPDGSTIIPISKVVVGFVAGGGEFGTGEKSPTSPFAGGSGAGLTVEPVGFLIGKNGEYKFVATLHTGYGELVEHGVSLLKTLKDGISNEKEI